MKKRRKKAATSKADKTNDQATSVPQQAEVEKPFDFGGLPQRDLKKNLGCG
jgi:hypothetical protein